MTQPGIPEATRTTFDEMCEPTVPFFEQHERDHTPYHREKLHFRDFARQLFYHFAKGCGSGRQLLTDVETADPQLELDEVKRSTFFDAFQRFPVAWFASLLAFVLATVVWQSVPEVTALGKLYCVDGSVFPAIASMLWAEYTGVHQPTSSHSSAPLFRVEPHDPGSLSGEHRQVE